jgi:hypothetical protein
MPEAENGGGLRNELEAVMKRRSAEDFRRRFDEQGVAGDGPVMMEVLEVDAQGRPRRAKVWERGSNALGVMELEGGYGVGAGAVHEYDPRSGLKRGGDEG